MSSLPEGWVETTLGEAVEILDGDRGKDYPKNEEFHANEHCLFLNTKNVPDTKFHFSATSFVTREKDSLLRKGKLKRGDYVLTTRGTLGNYAFYGEHILYDNIRINSGMVVLRAKDFVNKLYFGCWLRSNGFSHQVTQLSSGTAQPQLPIKDLRTFLINLPPLPEQKAIADMLSSFDEKIELLREQNKTLETLAQTIFKEWFVNFNYPDATGEMVDSDNPLAGKTTEGSPLEGESVSSNQLGEIPKGWRVVKVTELFEVRDGTHDSPKQKESGKLLITSKHLQNHKLDFESAYLISEEDYENINKRSLVETSDILFSMIGTIGLTYFEQSKNIDYAIKNVGLFKTSQNSSWAYYTYLWLTSSLGKDYVYSNKSGSTQEYISLTSLRNIIYCEPPESLLGAFNSAVSEVFCKIKNNTSQILTLSKTRDTLLPKLMSGEVRCEG